MSTKKIQLSDLSMPRIFGVNIFSRALLQWLKCFIKYQKQKRLHFNSPTELILDHFERWSIYDHPSRQGLTTAILAVSPPYNIFETGTAAWGCDSTRLFDSLTRVFGGRFVSVDLRPEASAWLKYQTSHNTTLYTSDSVEFILKKLDDVGLATIQLCYLDSLDMDFNYPLLSATHHLNEFRALQPYFRPGSVVVVDDQPFTIDEVPLQFRKMALEIEKDYGFLPGKATLILRELQNRTDISVLWKGQSVVFKFN